MVWLEVETKVKLKNSEVAPLRKKIKEIAVLKKKGKKTIITVDLAQKKASKNINYL